MDEPFVNFRDGMDFIDGGDAAAQGLGNDEDALVIDAREVLLDALVIPGIHLIHMQAVYADFQRTHSLEDGTFEVAVDAHDLARCLHLRAQRAVRVDELVKWPAREFDDAVVKRRLKAGFRLLRDGIRDFVQRIADGNLGRNLGNRITRSFRCQCRRTADARVYLDDIVFVAVRVEGILRVAAAFDAELADNAQRSTAEHLVLVVRQRLGRCHDNGVARMDADRVEVFHVADGDAVIIAVAHDFVLDFLPAGYAALDEDLANHRVVEALDDDIDELFFVLRDTAARAAHRISRAHDDRIADFIGKFHGRRHIFDDGRFRDRLAEFLHRLFEHFAVFCLFDRLKRRT